MDTSTGTETDTRANGRPVVGNLGFRGLLSVAFLGLAIVILGLVMVWTLTAAVTPNAAGCHNAPLRLTRVPQLLGVAVCVAGFAIGRVTARPKVTSRRNVRSWVGHDGRESDRAKAAVFVQACMVAGLLFIASLVSFEAVTLHGGVWPITYYMRCASEAATWQTLAAAFAFCLLTGRWMWLPATALDVD